jgi:chitinase
VRLAEWTAPLAFTAFCGPVHAEGTRPAVVAYVFPQDTRLDPGTIPADRVTHVNYAFANVRDGRIVEGFAHDAENFRTLAALRHRHPHLKVLVSIGGWTWSGGFSDAALTRASRRRFVGSVVDFVVRHDLDGADVDWEYPGLPGYGNVHRAEDKANFTSLMRELRAALDARGRRTKRTYLLTYDFLVPPGDGVAGHHSNLYAGAADPAGQSADRAVREFLAAGVPADKLVLGVPFYGRAWTVTEGEGPYRPGAEPRERVDGAYAALAASLARGEFVRRFDERAQAPYLWDAGRRLFVTYDDPESMARKAAYVRKHGLRGMMFWKLNDDGGVLLAAIHCGLAGGASVPECVALERERE